VVQAIEARLKELIGQMCQEHQAEVEELEVLPHHVHLLGSHDPQFGMHRLVKLIKGRSSRWLRMVTASQVFSEAISRAAWRIAW
jgi:putative transposase